MIKALFLDFYGTVAHEDDKIIKEITYKIYKSGNAEKQSDISSYWWRCFQSMVIESKKETFKTQREIEQLSLENTIRHFGSKEDALELSKGLFEFWVRPPLFKDSKMFFQHCPVPIIIVSNIDTDDIEKALAFHNLCPYGQVTSEEARSYKPQKEIFEYALKKYNLSSNEVLHIGDSVTSDVFGAKSAGIKAFWINRLGKPIPENVYATATNLLDVFKLGCFKEID